MQVDEIHPWFHYCIHFSWRSLRQVPVAIPAAPRPSLSLSSSPTNRVVHYPLGLFDLSASPAPLATATATNWIISPFTICSSGYFTLLHPGASLLFNLLLQGLRFLILPPLQVCCLDFSVYYLVPLKTTHPSRWSWTLKLIL